MHHLALALVPLYTQIEIGFAWHKGQGSLTSSRIGSGFLKAFLLPQEIVKIGEIVPGLLLPPLPCGTKTLV